MFKPISHHCMFFKTRMFCAFHPCMLLLIPYFVLNTTTSSAHAQTHANQNTLPSTTIQPVASDQTITRPAVGLSATLPVGASASTTEFANKKTTRIILPDETGLVNVSDITLTKPQTLAAIADSIINQRLDSVSQKHVNPNIPGASTPSRTTTNGSLLARTTITINNQPAERFYLRIRNLSGEDTVFGYCLFLPAGNTLAMFELQSPASAFPDARAYFEFITDSVHIADLSLTDAQRALGIEAGIAFFDSLTRRDYQEVIKKQGSDWHYERYYKPAPTGSDSDATELGYRRTRFALGTRGDIKSPGNKRGRADPSDRQKGYLVFQEARILDADYIIDISASFFMTPDRTQEAWSIHQSVRPRLSKAKAAATDTTETGIRDHNTMTVVQAVDGNTVETINPLIEGKGYISRAEVYLLPWLLLHKKATGTYRCYAYNQSAKRITLRQDSLEQPNDTPGLWTYTSKPDEESLGQTAYFNAKAQPMRAELPDGKQWEPITLKRLFSLWKAKNLPLE